MAGMSAHAVETALQAYAETLTANFALAGTNPAQPEDQLKGPTQTLLHTIGKSLGYEVIARTEALTTIGVRPDIGVSVNGLLAGHVELKAPGKGVRPRDFADAHDRAQFKRLSDHPNLVYTDGNQWALYRQGQLVGTTISAGGDVRVDGAAFLRPRDRRSLDGTPP
jgi:hypothetical protein